MKIEYKPFKRNNIEFRIASSKALERYKHQQYLFLSEIYSGSYKFSKVSREIAILSSDSYFTWLIELENHLIRNGKPLLSKEMSSRIINGYSHTVDYIDKVVSKHRDVFDEKYIFVLKKIHSYKTNALTSYVQSQEGVEIAFFYSGLVRLVIDMIENLTFELYEIDYMLHDGRRPFVCVTDFSIEVNEKNDVCIEAIRAKLYSSVFDAKKFFIKNYSSSPSDSGVEICLKNNGIEVVHK